MSGRRRLGELAGIICLAGAIGATLASSAIGQVRNTLAYYEEFDGAFTIQADGSILLPADPLGNVRLYRNGLRQKRVEDFVIDAAKPRVIVPRGKDGVLRPYSAADVVVIDYLRR